MSEAASSNTPSKRKRQQEEPALPSIPFSFDPAQVALGPSSQDSLRSHRSSPRSKFAHEFRGLDLKAEGQSTSQRSQETQVPPTSDSDDDLLEVATKRHRGKENVSDVVDLHQALTAAEHDNTPSTGLPLEHEGSGSGSLHRAYPSINRLSESKSRNSGRKRSGTPPLRLRKGPVHDVADDDDEDEADEEMEIIDPVRASLTWHEHEITVYDPEDEDDDGTGINGIGFKPTPALAHFRTLKRKQQLAEYKRREDTEARALRSERRRKGAGLGVGPEAEDDSARKVRFNTETDDQGEMVTT